MKRAFKKIKGFGQMLKTTASQWMERDPFASSAVIAYYTIFSLPGLLVIIVNIAGYFYGEQVVTGEITEQVGDVIGGESAGQIESILSNASQNEGTTLASILGLATLLFGATGVFYKMQQILNDIWQVKPQPKQKIVKLIKDRVFSFGLILVVGFLLLVSLVISAALSALSGWVTNYLSDGFLILFRAVDLLISVAIITVLFAAMYKFLPDARIRWSDVWSGALLTAVLFVVAKFALGFYFGNTDPASTYGAAGSIILIMLWVTYAAMIVFFGAEFTQVNATRRGHKIEPSSGAVSAAPTRGEGKIYDSAALRHKKA